MMTSGSSEVVFLFGLQRTMAPYAMINGSIFAQIQGHLCNNARDISYKVGKEHLQLACNISPCTVICEIVEIISSFVENKAKTVF